MRFSTTTLCTLPNAPIASFICKVHTVRHPRRTDGTLTAMASCKKDLGQCMYITTPAPPHPITKPFCGTTSNNVLISLFFCCPKLHLQRTSLRTVGTTIAITDRAHHSTVSTLKLTPQSAVRRSSSALVLRSPLVFLSRRPRPVLVRQLHLFSPPFFSRSPNFNLYQIRHTRVAVRINLNAPATTIISCDDDDDDDDDDLVSRKPLRQPPTTPTTPRRSSLTPALGFNRLCKSVASNLRACTTTHAE